MSNESVPEGKAGGRTVVFVFDYVMHYHRETLQRIEAHVVEQGGRFVLLSGYRPEVTSGRKPLSEKIVGEQYQYRLYERQVGNFTLRYQGGLVRRIWSVKPDIVVTMCHSGTATEWMIAALKKVLGFRLVAWQCGYEYNPGMLKRLVLGSFVPLFNHHLAYHSNAKKYAVDHGASDGDVTIMHNTVNEKAVECVAKPLARAQIDEKHPSLVGKTIVLYVGAVLQEKKLELVLDALDLLKDDSLAFLVVGDGPHLASVKKTASGRSDVVFAGRVVEGVGIYFDGSDMLVLPGTGGLALNEAMAHSLPLISSYADGSADDLVSNGVNGYRLETEDASELANCIRRLADSQELRLQMGAESRRMITGKYSFESFLGRVARVLDTV